jgi:hypothetical protein
VRTRRLVVLLVIALAVVFVVIGAAAGTMMMRAARSASELRTYVKARFSARPDCPVADPFVETNVEYDCFDGRSAAGRAVTLILGHEIDTRTTAWSYVGLFVKNGGLPPGFGATWLARVRARGDWWGRRENGPPRAHILLAPPENEPVRAEAVEGGFLVAWRLGSRLSPEKIDARLGELDAEWRGEP